MGIFDKFRFVNTAPIKYRYFPNRTKQQTKYLVWASFLLFGTMGWLLIKAFEQNSERLRGRFANQMEIARNDVLDGQTKEYQRRMAQVFRRQLGLSEHPPGNVEIKEPENDQNFVDFPASRR